MAFNLTPYEQRLIDNVKLIPAGIVPVSKFPTGGPEIKFQFPPNVTSDGKKYSWKEYAKSFVWEPVYIWGGGKPREITIKATYIVGGPGSSKVGRWSAQNVATETRRWKSYFYSAGASGLGQKLPIFQLVMYQNAPLPRKQGKKPPGHITIWRGLSISLKYSDTLVSDDGDPNNTFPLKTDITLKLALSSNIKTTDGESQFAFTGADQPPDRPEELWY